MTKIYSFSLTILLLNILTSCATNKVRPYNTKETNKTEIIQLADGMIRGVYNADKSVELYAGIPFAASPTGDFRWKEPQPVKKWDGILECDHFAPMAMQNQSGPIFTMLYNGYTHRSSRTDNGPKSEDCLYLNIWRPSDIKDGEKLPVLVYIHGGSLTSGQSWYESYDGENLAKENIIFVSIAYRVGVFGYFASEELASESPNHTTGNYGLLDQIAALKWVNDNISKFGGDAANITIAGESAGSSSVNALCCSPLSKGLFRRAIAESSSLVVPVPSHTFRTRENALKMGKDILAEFKCTSVNELRKIPAEKLVKTKFANNSMTVDEYSMPEFPWKLYEKGLNHEEALLNGFNADEANAFTFFQKVNLSNYETFWLERSPYIPDAHALALYGNPKTNKEAKRFYTDVFSVICFTYPHKSWSKVVSDQGKPVYLYYFEKENGQIGTNHSGEMVYAYKNLPRNRYYNDSDFYLENIMSSYWLNFIKYGNPNGENLPEWKTFSESNGQLIRFGNEVKMDEDPFNPFYNFIDFNIAEEKRPESYK